MKSIKLRYIGNYGGKSVSLSGGARTVTVMRAEKTIFECTEEESRSLIASGMFELVSESVGHHPDKDNKKPRSVKE